MKRVLIATVVYGAIGLAAATTSAQRATSGRRIWWSDPVVQRDLGLSASQVARLVAAFNRDLPARKALQESIWQAEAELGHLIARDDDARAERANADLAALHQRQNTRRSLMLLEMYFLTALILVSLDVAAFAIAFRASLTWWYAHVFAAGNVVDAMSGMPWWMRLLVPTAAGIVAGTISRLRSAGSQGVSNVMEAVALGKIQLSARTTLSRVAASWAAIASGLSIGREGPLIEFGGTLGASIGRWLRVDRAGTRVLVAAGTAAGFGAAYNTPFAAVLFVLETIVGIATPMAMLPTVAATVIATGVTRGIIGAGPIYGQRTFALQSSRDLVLFAALGVIAAGAAIGFRRVLIAMEDWWDRHPIPQPLRATVGGAIVGATR